MTGRAGSALHSPVGTHLACCKSTVGPGAGGQPPPDPARPRARPGHASGPAGIAPRRPCSIRRSSAGLVGGQHHFLAVVLPWTTSFTDDCRMDWPEITTALVFPIWALDLSVTWTQK